MRVTIKYAVKKMRVKSINAVSHSGNKATKKRPLIAKKKLVKAMRSLPLTVSLNGIMDNINIKTSMVIKAHKIEVNYSHPLLLVLLSQ
jgi:hypothetical protein